MQQREVLVVNIKRHIPFPCMTRGQDKNKMVSRHKYIY